VTEGCGAGHGVRQDAAAAPAGPCVWAAADAVRAGEHADDAVCGAAADRHLPHGARHGRHALRAPLDAGRPGQHVRRQAEGGEGRGRRCARRPGSVLRAAAPRALTADVHAGMLANLQYVFGTSHPGYWLLPSLEEAYENAKDHKGA